MITHAHDTPLIRWWFSPAKQGLFLTLLLCVFLLKPSIQPLIQMWLHDDNYNHGFLILLISLHLWWKNSDFFQLKNPLRSTFTLLVFCILYVIYLISTFLSIETFAYFVIPFLATLCLRVFSPSLSWKSVFIPAFFLFFALPVWNVLHTPLQKLTLLFCDYALHFFHIPFYIDGTTITTSEGYFDVETGCSGLRYLIVMLAFFYLKEKDAYSKGIQTSLMLFFLAVFLAIITNWIRVLTIILIGHQTKMKHSIIMNHDLLGWALFVLFFVVYLFISHYASSRHPPLKKMTIPTQTSTLLFSNHHPIYFLISAFVLFMLIPSQFLLAPSDNYTIPKKYETVEKYETPTTTESKPETEIEFPASSQLNTNDWLTIDQPKTDTEFTFLPQLFKALIQTLHQHSEAYQPRITHLIEKNHPDLGLTLYHIHFKSIYQLDSFFNLSAVSAIFPKQLFQHTPNPIAKNRSIANKSSSTTETLSTQPQIILQASLYLKNENNEKMAFQNKWQLLNIAIKGEIKSLEFVLYMYHCASSCDWLQAQLESTKNH